MIAIYGIKNCDTMKKAFAWLDEHNVIYEFHDYKKSGVDEAILQKALDQHGWEAVINRRGTTWRKLPDDVKANMNNETAIRVAIQNPSIIKRPLLITQDSVYLGFNTDMYNQLF